MKQNPPADWLLPKTQKPFTQQSFKPAIPKPRLPTEQERKESIYTRVVKFNAWHKKHKKMYEVIQIGFPPSGRCEVRVVGVSETLFFPKDVELLQYTNLNDKHEKEIYEGHVVRDPETDLVFEVLFRADRFMVERKITDPKNPGYDLADLYPLNEKVEVVGNIFEHPALLQRVGYSSLYEDDEEKPLKN